MTYYEMINYLESIKDSVRNDEMIAKLNNTQIDLEGDRYYRFVDHIAQLIQYRLEKLYDSFRSKIFYQEVSNEVFSLEFEEFKSEVTFMYKLAQIKLLKEENSKELIKSISTSNNKMLDEIKKLYEDNQNAIIILELINNAYREEDIE